MKPSVADVLQVCAKFRERATPLPIESTRFFWSLARYCGVHQSCASEPVCEEASESGTSSAPDALLSRTGPLPQVMQCGRWLDQGLRLPEHVGAPTVAVAHCLEIHARWHAAQPLTNVRPGQGSQGRSKICQINQVGYRSYGKAVASLQALADSRADLCRKNQNHLFIARRGRCRRAGLRRNGRSP